MATSAFFAATVAAAAAAAVAAAATVAATVPQKIETDPTPVRSFAPALAQPI